MLKTAPPETVEQAHAEAFSRLTPDQRRQVLGELANAAPPEERAFAEATSPEDPRRMGRLATRTEMRQPGFMERTFGGGGGLGFGASLLGSFAMGFVGSMVAQSFFASMGGFGGQDGGSDAEAGADTNDAQGEISTESSYNDAGGGDFDGGFDV